MAIELIWDDWSRWFGTYFGMIDRADLGHILGWLIELTWDIFWDDWSSRFGTYFGMIDRADLGHILGCLIEPIWDIFWDDWSSRFGTYFGMTDRADLGLGKSVAQKARVRHYRARSPNGWVTVTCWALRPPSHFSGVKYKSPSDETVNWCPPCAYACKTEDHIRMLKIL